MSTRHAAEGAAALVGAGEGTQGRGEGIGHRLCRHFLVY